MDLLETIEKLEDLSTQIEKRKTDAIQSLNNLEQKADDLQNRTLALEHRSNELTQLLESIKDRLAKF